MCVNMAEVVFDIEEIKESAPRAMALVGAILVACSYFMAGWEIDVDYYDDYSGDFSSSNEVDIEDADDAGIMFFLSLSTIAVCGLTRNFWDKNAGPGYQHKLMLGFAIGTAFFAYQVWDEMSEAEEDSEDLVDDLENSAYASDIDIDFKTKMGAHAMLVGALLLLGGSGMYFQEMNPKA